jgi:cytochrome d ubiquinol oxidase subunit II
MDFIFQNLSVIISVVIGASLLVYVFLDGVAIGSGIASFFMKDKQNRGMTMSSVLPFWDSNGTWIILSAVLLYAGFPKAYEMVTSIFYIPAVLLLIAICVRGMAFEFRNKKETHMQKWDIAYFIACSVIAFVEGAAAGNYLVGFNISDGNYNGGLFAWFNLPAIIAGLMVVVGYAILGYGWIVVKFENDIKKNAIELTGLFAKILLGLMPILLIVTLYLIPSVAQIWKERIYLIVPSVVLIFLSLVYLIVKAKKFKSDMSILYVSYLIVALSAATLIFTNFPYIVGRSISIFEHASDDYGRRFFMYGIMIFIPLISIYMCKNILVFRGKLKEKISY